MKDKKRFVRKELKEPDEFVSFFNRVIRYVLEHKREFIWGAAGVLLFILLVSAVTAYMESRERKAAVLFGQARNSLQPASPSGPSAGSQTPSSLDPVEEQEAVSALEKIVEDYGGTQAGQRSRLMLGQVYFERGDLDAALKVYEELLDKGKVPLEIKVMAWEGLAYVHESKGDVDQAVPWYQRLTKVDLSYIQPWAWMGLGRCYELAGKPDQAREAYQRFLADFPNHPKAPEVRALISKISHNAPPESGKKNGASEKPPVGEKPGEETGP